MAETGSSENAPANQTTSSGAVTINMTYLRSPKGILKIVEIVSISKELYFGKELVLGRKNIINQGHSSTPTQETRQGKKICCPPCKGLIILV